MLVNPDFIRQSTDMSDDPFSDVLKFANVQAMFSGGLRASGRWAIRFPPPDKVKFFAVVNGSGWIRFEDGDPDLEIAQGDVVLLTATRPFILATDFSAKMLDAKTVFAKQQGKIASLNDGDDFSLIGVHVHFEPPDLLAGALPPMICVRSASSRAGAMRWLLDELVRESATGAPGSEVASAQLAQLLFLNILRVHLETSGSSTGWLRAVTDRRLAPALRLIHGDPGHPWTLEELAKAAAMSRTTFAAHFKSTAGVAPLTYLTEWRMRLAEKTLREERTPVAVLARSLGYTSESAFSNAFKRVTGQAPKRFRGLQRTTQSPSGASDGVPL